MLSTAHPDRHLGSLPGLLVATKIPLFKVPEECLILSPFWRSPAGMKELAGKGKTEGNLP